MEHNFVEARRRYPISWRENDGSPYKCTAISAECNFGKDRCDADLSVTVTGGKSDKPAMVTIAQSGPNAFFGIGDTRFSVKLVDPGWYPCTVMEHLLIATNERIWVVMCSYTKQFGLEVSFQYDRDKLKLPLQYFDSMDAFGWLKKNHDKPCQVDVRVITSLKRIIRPRPYPLHPRHFVKKG